ncbi:MAG: hypothetical protein EAX86_06375 [Candidatus Heimdallarchaeota archaeon]|nr:hypothetical protein [Candidatus Heimdallarchaeota archaeon]
MNTSNRIIEKGKNPERSTRAFLSKIKIKGVFTKSETIAIPRYISFDIELENDQPFNNKRLFRKNLHSAFEEVSGPKTKEHLKFALHWSTFSSYYALFLKINHVSINDLTILRKYKLVHGYIDSYLVLSRRQKSLEYYSMVILLFKQFSSIIPSSKPKKLLFFRDNKGGSANPTFFFFSSPKGHGLFVKALSRKDRMDNPNMELQVLQIGKLIGLGLPHYAVLLYNNYSALFQLLAPDSDLLIEPLAPGTTDFYIASKEDIKELTLNDAENLGKMLVFDTVCGAWDRHSGNYLVISNRRGKTLREIDFGLFQPGFYKSEVSFTGDSDRQKRPSKYPRYPGWAITRNEKVTSMMKAVNQDQLIRGIKKAVKNLHSGLNTVDLSSYCSKKLTRRVYGLFDPSHSTYKLFLKELSDLNIDNQFFVQLIDKLALKKIFE